MKSVLIATLLVIAAVPLFAADSYSFRLDLPDGRFALSDATGAHWKTLGYKCGYALPDCELQINSVGASSARAGEVSEAKHGPFDLGIQRVDDKSAHLRCLRKQCVLTIGEKEVQLAKNETTEVTAGSRITLH